jgi:hypothetical protein
MDDYEEAVLFTFALLESRLDRIEYVLSGGKKEAEDKPRSLPERIRRIERSLQELGQKTALLEDVQQLSAPNCPSYQKSMLIDSSLQALRPAQSARRCG